MNIDDDIRIEKNCNGIETYVFDPYNPLNKLITKDEIQHVMTKYNVPFEPHNMELYKRMTLVIKQGYICKVFYPVFPSSENAQEVIKWLHSQD